jgi:cytoskeleton protein RodZ
MTSIGETLRRERLRRNLELAQISSELKISSRILEAIEAEKFDKLPGGVFTKSFVRQYARLLGLDEEEIASEMNRMLDPGPEAPQVAEKVEKPIPASVGFHVGRVQEWEAVGDQRFSRSSSLPALALVVLVMLVCSGVYAWWQRARHTAAPTPAPPPTSETVPALVPQQQTAPPRLRRPNRRPLRPRVPPRRRNRPHPTGAHSRPHQEPPPPIHPRHSPSPLPAPRNLPCGPRLWRRKQRLPQALCRPPMPTPQCAYS